MENLHHPAKNKPSYGDIRGSGDRCKSSHLLNFFLLAISVQFILSSNSLESQKLSMYNYYLPRGLSFAVPQIFPVLARLDG